MSSTVLFIFAMIDNLLLLFVNIYNVSENDVQQQRFLSLRLDHYVIGFGRRSDECSTMLWKTESSRKSNRKKTVKKFCFLQTFFPEAALHVVLTVFFIFYEHWFLFLFNVPIDLWFLYKFMRKQPGQLGIFDPLEINNRRNIKTNMRVRRKNSSIDE